MLDHLDVKMSHKCSIQWHEFYSFWCNAVEQYLEFSKTPHPWCRKYWGDIPTSESKIWVFPKMVVLPKWMVKIMENPIKLDDLGVPLFLETNISTHRVCQKWFRAAGNVTFLWGWYAFCSLPLFLESTYYHIWSRQTVGKSGNVKNISDVKKNNSMSL